jgi:hypothetical protein
LLVAAAGMQESVDAVRSTGARNPILVAGPQQAAARRSGRAWTTERQFCEESRL